MSSSSPTFTFSDLFAGIGGFHAALHAAGGTWAFASEIDDAAARVYDHNWLRPLRKSDAPLPPGVDSFEVSGDIVALTQATVDVPKTDVLAAGFPCQPFSKSGFQRGMQETRGTLFWNIARILQDEDKRPSVVLLENVRNLAGPRHKGTFATIVATLRELGYRTASAPLVFSPHLLPPELGGRPQVRERVFILAHHVGKDAAEDPDNFDDPIVNWRDLDHLGWLKRQWSLERDLPLQADAEVDSRFFLESKDQKFINTWDQLLTDVAERLGAGERLPGFPIWFDEFRTPEEAEQRIEAAELMDIPLPPWKREFLRKNALFYERHRDVIEIYRPIIESFPPSRRKFEWQAGPHRPLAETIMHFRPSGIRAKRADYVPALVAITQTSILGDRRRLTTREVARLQGLPESFEFMATTEDGPVRQGDAASYKQMGNGVNVGAAYFLFREYVLRYADEIPSHIVDAVRDAPPSPDWDLEVSEHRQHDTVEFDEISSERAAEGAFVPARDKLEVVNRISAAVGGPREELGPGSKERKSVLLSVARRLDVPEDVRRRNKPDLAQHLVELMGGTWATDCWSAGHTLTLKGLNELLRCVELTVHADGPRAVHRSPEAEAEAILEVVVRHTPARVSGREAVAEMHAAQSTDWAKTEWPGFYFEFRNLGPLMASLGGAPAVTNNRNCVLDLKADHVWDLKVHSAGVPWTILNDKAATDWTLERHGGIGLVVLTAEMELDPEFAEWFAQYRADHGKKAQPRTRERAYKRRLKSAARARQLEVLYFTQAGWQCAVDAGVIRGWAQPPQPGGQPRNPKYQIALGLASEWVVASHEW